MAHEQDSESDTSEATRQRQPDTSQNRAISTHTTTPTHQHTTQLERALDDAPLNHDERESARHTSTKPRATKQQQRREDRRGKRVAVLCFAPSLSRCLSLALAVASMAPERSTAAATATTTAAAPPSAAATITKPGPVRLFVGGVGSCTADLLRQRFSSFGTVSAVELVPTKGIAFVTLSDQDAGVRANRCMFY